MTTREDSTLHEAKSTFENHALSHTYTTWVKQATEAFAFYDGNQLTEHEEQTLLERGQAPIIINKIKPRIDAITAMEIRSRTKLKFRARSQKKEEIETSEAISDLAYFQQDKEDSTYKLSQIGHHARLCGIGWHVFDITDSTIIEEIGNPFEFVWDTSDMSNDLSHSQFVCKLSWLTKEAAINAFPEHEEYFLRTLRNQKNTNRYIITSLPQQEFTNYNHPIFKGSYIDANSNRILIVECQYKKKTTRYEVITHQNTVIDTFDKKEALILAKSKEFIRPLTGYKVFSAYFTGNQLLKHIALPWQDNKKEGDFLYTPFVLQREHLSGIPYGLVKSAITSQKLYNKKSSKLLWLMSARQVLAEANAIDNLEIFSSQAARPDGIMLVRTGALSKIILDKNQPEIATHASSLHQHDREVQDALGIHDDSLGIATNAQSGMAIRQRQIGSVQTHTMALDRFRAMKKRYGYKLLHLIRAVFTEERAFFIIDDENRVKQIHLNEPVLDSYGIPAKDPSGNVILKNDIRTGEYDLYIEEVPDNATQIEEARDRVMDLLKSGIPLSREILSLFGIPKLAELYSSLLGQPGTNYNKP